MKAEERKELETNVLADKLGKIVKGAKKGPSRKGIFLVLGLLGLLLALLIWQRFQGADQRENSERWVNFLKGDWTRNKVGTKQHQYALFQDAHNNLWEEGIKKFMLPNQGQNALQHIKTAESVYRSLAKQFQDDPTMHAEALYHLGVIQEYLSLENPDGLDNDLQEAKKKYEEAYKKAKDTCLGKLSKARVEKLNDEDERKKIVETYRQIAVWSGISRIPANLPEKK